MLIIPKSKIAPEKVPLMLSQALQEQIEKMMNELVSVRSFQKLDAEQKAQVWFSGVLIPAMALMLAQTGTKENRDMFEDAVVRAYGAACRMADGEYLKPSNGLLALDAGEGEV